MYVPSSLVEDYQSASGLTQVDWIGAASVGATTAIVSVLIALATGLPELDDGEGASDEQ